VCINGLCNIFLAVSMALILFHSITCICPDKICELETFYLNLKISGVRFRHHRAHSPRIHFPSAESALKFRWLRQPSSYSWPVNFRVKFKNITLCQSCVRAHSYCWLKLVWRGWGESDWIFSWCHFITFFVSVYIANNGLAKFLAKFVFESKSKSHFTSVLFWVVSARFDVSIRTFIVYKIDV
jgi:hypothetical protein